jgi:DNA mismatch repair protein MutL
LAFVDQHRAHVRILYDQYLARIRQQKGVSQQVLFPEIIEFTPVEALTLPAIREQLYFAGFDLSHLGSNSYAINGVPAGIVNVSPVALVRDAVQQTIETDGSPREDVNEAIALSLSKAAAIPAGKHLSADEMNGLIASLFTASSSTYTPDGKLIVSMCTDDELEKRFK